MTIHLLLLTLSILSLKWGDDAFLAEGRSGRERLWGSPDVSCVLVQPVKVRVRADRPRPGCCFCLSFGAGWGVLLTKLKFKEGHSLEGPPSLPPVQPWAPAARSWVWRTPGVSAEKNP